MEACGAIGDLRPCRKPSAKPGSISSAQDTLKQNWSKYAASDKSDCVGRVKTGGPASYVELLSCVEILRDARNIRNADALESDNESVSTRRGRDNARPVRARRRHST
jgi:hypothetical protein